MLTKEQNQIICSVGPGTSTGKLFRSIWLPALQSAQLSKHAGPPVRLKLLGEELVDGWQPSDLPHVIQAQEENLAESHWPNAYSFGRIHSPRH